MKVLDSFGGMVKDECYEGQSVGENIEVKFGFGVTETGQAVDSEGKGGYGGNQVETEECAMETDVLFAQMDLVEEDPGTHISLLDPD